MFMIKKGLAVASIAGATLLTGFALLGSDLFSYASTSAGWVKSSVKDSVPMDFEIDRARGLIKSLVPDIRHNMHVIAKEEVEVARLEKQIGQNEGAQEKSKAELMTLKTDLQSGKDVFHYAGRKYTVDQVKTDLANRFERFKTNDATLASLKDMLTARRNSLDAARQKLDGMLAAKRQLEVDVEHLEARLKMVEAAQTTSEVTFDDSQLSRAKDLVAELRGRLEVAERLVHSEGTYQGEIPLETPDAETVVDEMAKYFGEATATDEQVAEHAVPAIEQVH